MPLYDFQCEECGTEFEQYARIEFRDGKIDCPVCKGHQTKRKVAAPPLVSQVATNPKPPDGFKDLLNHIKKGSGKDCTINT